MIDDLPIEAARAGFEYDMFLGGPPDRRVDVPYRELIKKAFPDLRIYDWESYKGDDYQKRNNEMLKKSLMMVSWVPVFRMPGIGPEVGYFYGLHQEWIEQGRRGLWVGCGTDPNGENKPKFTQPVHYSILIWPDSVQTEFIKRWPTLEVSTSRIDWLEAYKVDTRKTIGEYALIVPTVEEAIATVKSNLKAFKQFNDFYTNNPR